MEWTTPPTDFKSAMLTRINPEKNEARFYYVAYQPTLFHPGAVVRMYGRMGEWQRVLSPIPFNDLAEAWPLISRVVRTRLRHGYRLVEIIPPSLNDRDLTVDDRRAYRLKRYELQE